MSIAIVHAFRSLGAASVEVFPRANGGILVAGYHGDISVDAALDSTSKVELVVDKGDAEIYAKQGLGIPDMVNLVREQRWLSGLSSDSSIHETTLVWLSNVSSQQLSKIQKTMEESPWFCSHVSMRPVALPVNTFGGIMQQVLPVSLLYSGDSKKRYYHTVTR
jgi:hypothetical protein